MLASLAHLSSSRPIQTIVLTAILTAVAYLSIVDEFIGLGPSDDAGVSYYHLPSSSDSWTIISNPAEYPAALHVAVAPLSFRPGHTPPDIPDTIYTHYSSEKFLIVDYAQLPARLEGLSNLASEDTAWKAVHQYKVGRYREYFGKAYQKVRALVVGAEPYDIAVVTVAYVAMYYTLFKLFYDMRAQTGLRFWLAFGCLTSSLFAFLLAFATTTFLGFKVSLLSLSEGIPFLVATVGFDRVVRLSVAVLDSSSEGGAPSQLKNALQNTALNFVKDQLLCAAAFTACAVYAPHLEGLRSFCVLSALIMVYDVVLTFTYYASVLALKIEISAIHRAASYEAALKEDGIPEKAARKTVLDTWKPSNSFQNDSGLVTLFKLVSVGLFVAFHVWLVGSNWVFSQDASAETEVVHNLLRSLAKHIPIGEHGTVVTFVEPHVFVPKNVLIQTEDVFFSFLERLSAAIRDKLISKVLFFFLGTSAAINAYLLNAARVLGATQTTQIQKVEEVKPKPEPKKKRTVISGDVRPVEECVKLLQEDPDLLLDSEVAQLSVLGKLPLYALEKRLGDTTRAVAVRRKAISVLADAPVVDLDLVPYLGYDYDKVFGACCENVIGYIPLPLGIAGPLVIDGKPYHIPMATTEGCLVASTMRGCKAMNAGGGVTTILTRDGMTRGPCVRFPSLARAGACKLWLDLEEGQELLKRDFNLTLRFARLQHVQTAIAGLLLFIRFRTTTGDAMGMNMILKGVEHALVQMVTAHGWSDMEVVLVLGNYCSDKKSAAVNWVNGRGKSVVAEARVPAEMVKKVLKTNVDALVELNISKNLVGSAVAGAIGGFNAHAANLVTAVYLACGQDPAQNVESLNCITLMHKDGEDLVISVSMPLIEVGTIGGGTILGPQAAMLELLGVRGPHATLPGANAQQLAKIVASAVLAAELSLMSALAAGHLVQSHMTHNRGSGKIDKGCK